MFELFADEGFAKEMGRMAGSQQETIRGALKGLLDHPMEHPKVARLHGSRYPGSFRMRIGRHRVLGLVLVSQRLILLTTIFEKKRESDYDQVWVRHEARLASQGPPFGDVIRAARKRKAG